MNKIMLGIAIILFNILLALCTSGLQVFALIIGFAGLLLSVWGYGEEQDQK